MRDISLHSHLSILPYLLSHFTAESNCYSTFLMSCVVHLWLWPACQLIFKNIAVIGSRPRVSKGRLIDDAKLPIGVNVSVVFCLIGL